MQSCLCRCEYTYWCLNPVTACGLSGGKQASGKERDAMEWSVLRSISSVKQPASIEKLRSDSTGPATVANAEECMRVLPSVYCS